MAKLNRKKEKIKIKEEKKLSNQKIKNKIIEKEKKVVKKIDIDKSNLSSNNFNKIVEKITNKNIFRPYPDINDIPD